MPALRPSSGRSTGCRVSARGPIGDADLACYARLEPRTLLRRFVNATGMKPSEFQRRLRIGRAREMLEFSRASIDAIAASVGYDDVAGFRRVFRRIVGLTPSEPPAILQDQAVLGPFGPPASCGETAVHRATMTDCLRTGFLWRASL